MADNNSRKGERYATAEVSDYVNRVHAAHDAGLDEAFDAPNQHDIPAIMIGPSEGKTLEILCRLARVERAVEIGTLAGYSAIWLARGMSPGGKLYSLELNEKHAAVARAAVETAGLTDRVEIIVGDALESLEDLKAQGPFDLVFIDADKGRYDQYGRWAAQNLREGGLLIGDNSYFFGRLLESDTNADAMRRFHEQSADLFNSVCLPTPDGMVVGIRSDSLDENIIPDH
jgi:caffeoyl-CoA O-methyltransferase